MKIVADTDETPQAAEAALEEREAERIRTQEEAARRATLRFWTKTVCACLGAGAIAFGLKVGAEYMMTLPVFSFSTLELSNETDRVPMARVKEAVQKSLNGNYFSADLNAVREEIERVPWVRRATVRRSWPNGLEIGVETYQALALYEDGRLVSTDGVLFSANLDERENPTEMLPNFYGPALQAETITRYYRAFTRALQPLGAVVTDVHCSDRGSWSLVMASPDIPPTRIELGQEEEGSVPGIIEKLASLVSAYPKVVELMDGPPASVDLRYNRAFAAELPDHEALKRFKEAKERVPDTNAPSEPVPEESNENPE